MEKFIPTNKITIRHYLTEKAYEAYAHVRQANDINVIGKTLTVYDKSVIDDKLGAMNEITNAKLTALRKDVDTVANDVTNNITVKLNEVRANTYTKAESDEKERAIRADIPKKLPADGGNADTVGGKAPNNKAGNLLVLSGTGKVDNELLNPIDAARLGGHRPDEFALKKDLPTEMIASGGNADTVRNAKPGNQEGDIALLSTYNKIPERFLDLSSYAYRSDLSAYVRRSELWSGNKLCFPDGTRMWLE